MSQLLSQISKLVHAELALMLQDYINAINTPGVVPEIGSIYEIALRNTCDKAMNDAKMLYISQMNEQILPVESIELIAAHNAAFRIAVDSFEEATLLESRQTVYKEYHTKLQVRINYMAI